MSNTFTGLAIEGMLKLDKHLFAFGQSLPNKQQIKKDSKYNNYLFQQSHIFLFESPLEIKEYDRIRAQKRRDLAKEKPNSKKIENTYRK